MEFIVELQGKKKLHLIGSLLDWVSFLNLSAGVHFATFSYSYLLIIGYSLLFAWNDLSRFRYFALFFSSDITSIQLYL